MKVRGSPDDDGFDPWGWMDLPVPWHAIFYSALAVLVVLLLTLGTAWWLRYPAGVLTTG